MHPAAEKIRGKTLHVILEKFFIMPTSSLYTAYRLTITDCQNDVLIIIVYIHHIEPVISENLGFFTLNFLAIFLPRQENGQKIEREKAEILRDYRLNMMNVYNDYKDIILAVSNR